MHTPDEIKKGLEIHCRAEESCEGICPYKGSIADGDCISALMPDALALIEQLKQQVPKWMNDDGSILCPYCGTTMRMIPAWQKSMPDMGGYMWAARGKCPACGSITPEMHGRTAKEANAAAYAAAQWGHMPQLEKHILDIPKKVEAQSGTDTNVPRWISVRDRLPERGCKVLTVNGHGYIRIFALWKRTEREWCWIDDAGHFNHTNDITYWMPLPEAPKEG